jgi:hypothetical protein
VTVDELLSLWGYGSLDEIETAGGDLDNSGASFRDVPVEPLPDSLDPTGAENADPLAGTELTFDDGFIDDAADQAGDDNSLLAVTQQQQLAAAEAGAQAPLPDEDDEEPEEPDDDDNNVVMAQGDGGPVALAAAAEGDGGDPLDVADMLVGFDPGEEADYVAVAFEDGDTVVSVDFDGTGNAFDFVELATLQGMVSFDDVIAQMQLTNDV